MQRNIILIFITINNMFKKKNNLYLFCTCKILSWLHNTRKHVIYFSGRNSLKTFSFPFFSKDELNILNSEMSGISRCFVAESQGLEAARFKCKLTLLFRTQLFPLRRKNTHTHTQGRCYILVSLWYTLYRLQSVSRLTKGIHDKQHRHWGLGE